MAMPADHKGWAQPTRTANAKFHWFNENARSLCGKWSLALASDKAFDRQDIGACKDQCKECWRRYKALDAKHPVIGYTPEKKRDLVGVSDPKEVRVVRIIEYKGTEESVRKAISLSRQVGVTECTGYTMTIAEHLNELPPLLELEPGQVSDALKVVANKIVDNPIPPVTITLDQIQDAVIKRIVSPSLQIQVVGRGTRTLREIAESGTSAYNWPLLGVRFYQASDDCVMAYVSKSRPLKGTHIVGQGSTGAEAWIDLMGKLGAV